MSLPTEQNYIQGWLVCMECMFDEQSQSGVVVQIDELPAAERWS